MTPQRFLISGSTRVLAADEEGIELEGTQRLRPGREVDLIQGRGSMVARETRRALVWSWRLVGLGNDGPLYRGYCRWTTCARARDTPGLDSRDST